MRTGFGDAEASSLAVGCVLYKSTQKIVHRVAGNKSGKNTTRDCWIKRAITPIIPNTNPSPLARGMAPALSIWFGDIITQCSCVVYISMYFFSERNPSDFTCRQGQRLPRHWLSIADGRRHPVPLRSCPRMPAINQEPQPRLQGDTER